MRNKYVKKILIQKMQILNTLLMNFGLLAGLEIFGGMFYLSIIVQLWLPIISPEIARENFYQRESWILVILVSLVFLFMLWAVRSYISDLLSSLKRLFEVLFVTSYIQRDSLVMPVDLKHKVESMTAVFEPYTVLDPKGEKFKTIFFTFLRILVGGLVLYWVGSLSIKNFSLPDNTVVQYISLTTFVVLQILFICLPGKKITL